MSAVTIKRHDTKVRFTDTPTIDGAPLDPTSLVGATVKFILKSSSTLITAAAVIDTSGANPIFYYDPVAGDVAVSGSYQQEWEVTYASGKKLTFPNGAYNTVTIMDDLDNV